MLGKLYSWKVIILAWVLVGVYGCSSHLVVRTGETTYSAGVTFSKSEVE